MCIVVSIFLSAMGVVTPTIGAMGTGPSPVPASGSHTSSLDVPPGDRRRSCRISAQDGSRILEKFYRKGPGGLQEGDEEEGRWA